ncbi:MAG: hypothetical protein Faunusvirus13_4 [Faunusvirus sp.]|jgi:hypothetical protein|uniref:Uncharacterized protein n=1 Tax=Faunusvirus sp. TaxID=2487766 RepID=A0A3G4ZZH7_9VIRU|nr:MAG: hypothetical protein Faunusvirus13_4 [Faunusvirus sp.]
MSQIIPYICTSIGLTMGIIIASISISNSTVRSVSNNNKIGIYYGSYNDGYRAISYKPKITRPGMIN